MEPSTTPPNTEGFNFAYWNLDGFSTRSACTVEEVLHKNVCPYLIVKSSLAMMFKFVTTFRSKLICLHKPNSKHIYWNHFDQYIRSRFHGDKTLHCAFRRYTLWPWQKPTIEGMYQNNGFISMDIKFGMPTEEDAIRCTIWEICQTFMLATNLATIIIIITSQAVLYIDYTTVDILKSSQNNTRGLKVDPRTQKITSHQT